MGSFRSQPDLVKHTQVKNGLGNMSYAVSHMCGTSSPTQVGASTWKTLTSATHQSATPRIPSSESSTDTEVNLSSSRRLSRCFRLAPLPQRTRGQQKLPAQQIRGGTSRDLPENGCPTLQRGGQKIDHLHPEGNAGQG